MGDLAAMWQAAAMQRDLRGPATSTTGAALRDGAMPLWDTFDLHLLDVRPADAFSAGHIPDAASIPAVELRARAHELPRDRSRLLIVGATVEEARKAAGSLMQRDEATPTSTAATAPAATSATAPASTPATTSVAVAADAAAWPGPWETGLARRVLWEPSPAVRAWAQRLPAGRALDLGCGTGRDAVHLAAAGHDVLAVDRLPEALDRAATLARRFGLSMRTLALDLRRAQPPAADGFDLILMIRFLDRALLPWAAAALRPGGCLILETFASGPRRDRWILAPQEALRVVESWNAACPPVGGMGWSVLEYVEGVGAPGAAMTRLVARKGSHDDAHHHHRSRARW